MSNRQTLLGSVSFDPAFVERYFDAPDRDEKIVAHHMGLYEQAHPGLRITKLEAETASEQLAGLRGEWQRANQEKAKADYLTEKQASERVTPLTLHDWLNYLMVLVPSLAGVFVATYALAVYAADSGVVAALDKNAFAAWLLAFPVIACAQATKAVGSLQKDDAAKTRYFKWLARLAAIAFGLFVVGVAIAFAPHPTDYAAMQAALTTGAPPPNAFASFCKDAAPYLTVGGGLIAEILAAAVIAHRADGINALGRSFSQGLTVTQQVLDERIATLQHKIGSCARKAGKLQADIARHEAALAAIIQAAQAHARELATQYAAFTARSRHEFLSQHSNKDI